MLKKKTQMCGYNDCIYRVFDRCSHFEFFSNHKRCTLPGLVGGFPPHAATKPLKEQSHQKGAVPFKRNANMTRLANPRDDVTASSVCLLEYFLLSLNFRWCCKWDTKRNPATLKGTVIRSAAPQRQVCFLEATVLDVPFA